MVSFLTLVASEHPTPQLLMREKQECNCSTKSLRKMTEVSRVLSVTEVAFGELSPLVYYFFFRVKRILK